jgi:hypothetical protein
LARIAFIAALRGAVDTICRAPCWTESFKSNDLAGNRPSRLMRKSTAEPLFTPIQGKLLNYIGPSGYYNLEPISRFVSVS